MNSVLRMIRRVAAAGPNDDEADDQLLSRFVADRDEAAFTVLVRRHGPMVLGVCSRILREANDVEDAFQATFLVLVRKAHAIGRPELLAGWLHGVASRIALKARGRAARHRRAPLDGLDPVAPHVPDEAAQSDLRQLLDEEVNRLPHSYRIPFILCQVEGRTHEEAAQLLGCPRATITTRVVRARERLRGQLTRRGLVLSAGMIAAVLAQDWARAVPAAVTEETVRVVTLAAAGATAGLPARVVSLTDSVTRAMTMNKIKLLLVVLLGLGVLLGGVGAFTLPGWASAPARQPKPADKPDEKPRSDKGVSVKSMPPAVVKTVPQAGDTKVDAKTTTEIRVTFSKDMMDKSWSWAQISDDTFPQTNGEISYDKDMRTCIWPVKLQPGKTYVIWVNSGKFGNFKDSDDNSAVPYLLVFETKP
jgi:RNA polymerase sigma-70 factor (ECF subfamily)